MAKEEVKTEAGSPVLAIPIDQLKQFMIDILKEVKAPTEKELAAEKKLEEQIARKKEFWHEQDKMNVLAKKRAEEACGHRRPEDNRSLVHWAPLVYPQGAWVGFCSRCPKEFKNFREDPKTHEVKLVNNDEEYNYWRSVPVGW